MGAGIELEHIDIGPQFRAPPSEPRHHVQMSERRSRRSWFAVIGALALLGATALMVMDARRTTTRRRPVSTWLDPGSAGLPGRVKLQVAGLQSTAAPVLQTSLTFYDRPKCDGGVEFDLSMFGPLRGAAPPAYSESPVTSRSVTCTPAGSSASVSVTIFSLSWVGPQGSVTVSSSADAAAIRKFADSLRALTRDQWVAEARLAPVRFSDNGELGANGGSPRPPRDAVDCTLGLIAAEMSADGLPSLADATTDPARAELALAGNRDRLLETYRDAVSVSVGPGFGRAWTGVHGGPYSIVPVRDYAIIVQVPTPAQCPSHSPPPAWVDGVPVLLSPTPGTSTSSVSTTSASHAASPDNETVSVTVAMPDGNSYTIAYPAQLDLLGLGLSVDAAADGTFLRGAGFGRPLDLNAADPTKIKEVEVVFGACAGNNGDTDTEARRIFPAGPVQAVAWCDPGTGLHVSAVGPDDFLRLIAQKLTIARA